LTFNQRVNVNQSNLGGVSFTLSAKAASVTGFIHTLVLFDWASKWGLQYSRQTRFRCATVAPKPFYAFLNHMLLCIGSNARTPCSPYRSASMTWSMHHIPKSSNIWASIYLFN